MAKTWKQLYGNKKEYRFEKIRFGNGSYIKFDNMEQAKDYAEKEANKSSEVYAYQQWLPRRTEPKLVKPKHLKHLSEKDIIKMYKAQGYDVRNYGGH